MPAVLTVAQHYSPAPVLCTHSEPLRGHQTPAVGSTLRMRSPGPRSAGGAAHDNARIDRRGFVVRERHTTSADAFGRSTAALAQPHARSLPMDCSAVLAGAPCVPESPIPRTAPAALGHTALDVQTAAADAALGFAPSRQDTGDLQAAVIVMPVFAPRAAPVPASFWQAAYLTLGAHDTPP